MVDASDDIDGAKRPRARIEGRGYAVPRAAAPVDLHLDANEGPPPPRELLEVMRGVEPDLLRRYPDKSSIEALLAERLEVDEAQILVTNGGDDAIDRACRAYLGPGRTLVMHTPSFEMIRRYAEISGGHVRRVPWPPGRFPLAAFLAEIDEAGCEDEEVGVAAIVSPNNPTGSVVTPADLRRLSQAAPDTLLLVDLAYVEFADEDLTEVVLGLPNAVAIRTLSKAWGLAGLRLGYAVGQAELLEPMRAAGGPYPVAAPSVVLAAEHLRSGEVSMQRCVTHVRAERAHLTKLLHAAGFAAFPSQGNFVFVKIGDGVWWRDAMAGLGIGIRAFPEHPQIADCVRITMPGDAALFARLCEAVQTIADPQALLFDLDGVIADVRASYREAIIGTAEHFGVALTREDIAAAKAQGAANNDWALTHRLLGRAGVEVELEDVIDRFEAIYQGSDEVEGLWARETTLCERAFFERLAEHWRLGIVTGRPRGDAERFLDQAGLADLFEVVVCMEDAPIKPDPAPVRRAMSLMEVERAWMIGDTPDDVVAARRAGVLPIGSVAPGERFDEVEKVLIRAGAARVLNRVSELEELLPWRT